MSWFDAATIKTLERYLDCTLVRQGLISSNIANVDTPGYKTRDIDFEKELNSAIANQSAEMSQPKVQEVPGLVERPDGNNVNEEREAMLLAQTQLQFRVGVELLRLEFRKISTAITEGRS